MIVYNWNFITRVSVGFEYLTDKDLGEEVMDGLLS